jgi:toxin HigB-1
LTRRKQYAYVIFVISTFRNKSLAELWSSGSSAKIDKRLRDRILLRLDRLDACSSPAEMNLPGFDFHMLKGFNPTRYTVHVNGPWCLTFEFLDGDAFRVDLEQYH